MVWMNNEPHDHMNTLFIIGLPLPLMRWSLGTFGSRDQSRRWHDGGGRGFATPKSSAWFALRWFLLFVVPNFPFYTFRAAHLAWWRIMGETDGGVSLRYQAVGLVTFSTLVVILRRSWFAVSHSVYYIFDFHISGLDVVLATVYNRSLPALEFSFSKNSCNSLLVTWTCFVIQRFKG